jgi:hypothetical protein
MARGGWRIVIGLAVLPAALAGCGNGSGHPASAEAAKAAPADGITASMLKGALLTRVNGVTAAAPASTGKYASVSPASTSKQAADGAQVSPKACTASATEGFDSAALAGAPAAAVTFQVAGNGVSEVLVASSAKSASTALAGHVPAGCSRYEEKVEGKTFSYAIKEQSIAGVGAEARVLNVKAVGVRSDDQWSLVYRGAGFVGTVTVVGPNASEKAVQELGQQAYAFAAKTLS